MTRKEVKLCKMKSVILIAAISVLSGASDVGAKENSSVRFSKACGDGTTNIFTYLVPSKSKPPAKNCLFELDTELVDDGASFVVVPIQKVHGGYLIAGVPAMTRDPLPPGRARNTDQVLGTAFLYTNRELSKGEDLVGYAYYSGQYIYTGLDGFEKAIYAFRDYKPTRAEIQEICLSEWKRSRSPDQTDADVVKGATDCASISIAKLKQGSTNPVFAQSISVLKHEWKVDGPADIPAVVRLTWTASIKNLSGKVRSASIQYKLLQSGGSPRWGSSTKVQIPPGEVYEAVGHGEINVYDLREIVTAQICVQPELMGGSQFCTPPQTRTAPSVPVD